MEERPCDSGFGSGQWLGKSFDRIGSWKCCKIAVAREEAERISVQWWSFGIRLTIYIQQFFAKEGTSSFVQRIQSAELNGADLFTAKDEWHLILNTDELAAVPSKPTMKVGRCRWGPCTVRPLLGIPCLWRYPIWSVSYSASRFIDFF